MGIFDRFRRAQGSDRIGNDLIAQGDEYVDLDIALGGNFREIMSGIQGMSPATLWTEQPYLRTVVNFMARNIAQLGVHVYQRVGETDRQRVRDGALAEALARPNRSTTGYDLIFGLVADLALYDRGLWLVTPDEAENRIVRLPAPWVTVAGGDLLGPDRYIVRTKNDGQARVIPADQVLDFHGWHPRSLSLGSTPVESLKSILAEQIAASKYRNQVWERGGRVSSVITRPAGTQWSEEARARFSRDWRDKYAGNGAQAGGTPILEDGMTINKLDFNAHEQQFVEGARLALNTVASVYHINPTMIGLLDNANYSNVREFRKMLYGDTLGPVIAQIEDRLNAFLVPMLDDRDGVYVEFNIEEKLQGNFEEQTLALTSSVGAPWMTRNEGRALRNMPALEGGDELVTPMNVLTGGQASPRDSGSQNRNSGPSPRFKQRADESWQEKYSDVLSKFFGRQERVVKIALGAKADGDWWDGERWDRELADDLFALFAASSPEVGAKVLADRGYDASDYDKDRTLKFLRSVAESRAGMVNRATQSKIQTSIDDPDTTMTPASIFDEAKGSRSNEIATTLVTTISAFATVEAAKHVAPGSATKTWIVTSRNPRGSHSSMDGETVGIEEPFSNGMNWPGDPVGGPNEVAGCLCDVEINIP